MKKIIVLICALCAISLALTETRASVLDELEISVVFIHGPCVETRTADGKNMQVWTIDPYVGSPQPALTPLAGTGFFVATESNGCYLVTAEHIAASLLPQSLVSVKSISNSVLTISLSDLSDSPTGRLPWVVDHTNDVAILPVKLLAVLERHFLPLSMLDEKESAPGRETVLTVLVFPLALGTERSFSPISRESKPASGLLTLPRADTRTMATFFLLEQTTIGGFSGAPLFDAQSVQIGSGGITMFSGRVPKCVGLIHGSIGDPNGRMAAVVPAIYVRSAIRRADDQRQSN